MNATSDAAVDEIDQAWGSVAKVQAAVRKYVLTGAAADRGKVDGATADFHRHVAEARKVLAADGPEFVPDLDAYAAKADVYLDQIIRPEVQLATDAATRQKAVDMVASDAAAPIAAPMEDALKSLEGKVEPWADNFTVAGTQAMDRIVWIVSAAGVTAAVARR